MSKKRKIEFRDGRFQISKSKSPTVSANTLTLATELEQTSFLPNKNSENTLSEIKTTTKIENFKNHLKPGRFYRRSDLVSWTKSLSPLMVRLMASGALVRMASGLYYCPKKSTFENDIIDDKKLIKTFLNSGRFVIVSPRAFNKVGIDTQLLGNKTIVYNHERNSSVKMDGRIFLFRKRKSLPSTLSKEFLLVEAINSTDIITGNKKALLKLIGEKTRKVNPKALAQAVHNYGDSWAKKFFAKIAANRSSLKTDHFFQKTERIRPGPVPKFTAEQIRDVRQRRQNGQTVVEIARFYKVSISMISKYTKTQERGRQILFTPEQKEEIRQMRKQGKRVKEIAKHYNASSEYVALITAKGKAGRRELLSPKQKEEIKRLLYYGYKSVKEIAREYSVSSSTIRRV